MRSWYLSVQKERLNARTVDTVCHMSGFVTIRTTVVMAQMRRVSVFACVRQCPKSGFLSCHFLCQEQ